MRILTHSRLATFRACPRKHWFAYVMGKRAIKKAQPLKFGTLIHECLKCYWMGRKLGIDRLEILDIIQSVSMWADFDPFVQQKARAMLTCYLAKWDLVPCEVLEVERVFSLPLVHPETGEISKDWVLGGKIDAIVRFPNQEIKPLEHKTTSDEAKPGGSYRQRLYMDGQVSQYFRGSRVLGYPPSGLVYDILRKPRQTPLKATPEDSRVIVNKGKPNEKLKSGQRDRDETPEEYGARVMTVMTKDPHRFIIALELSRSPRDERAYAFNVWQYADQMMRSETTEEAPQNPDSCWKYETACEFWDVCTYGCSINDPTRFRSPQDVNEELMDSEEPAETEETEESTDDAL